MRLLISVLTTAVTAATMFPGSARAQRWQLDLGGTSVGYDTAGSVPSIMFSPMLEWSGTAISGLVSGGIAAFEAAQWTAQGRGDLSLLFSPVGMAHPWRIEVAATAAGSMHSSAYRTATTRGELRLHWSGRALGVWAAGHAGTGWTSDTSGIASAIGYSLGLWSRSGSWHALGVWAPFRFGDSWFPEANGRVSTSFGPVDIMVYAGWRGAPDNIGIEQARWAGGSVALWLTPAAALVFAGGHYPLDLLQALPQGRYLSASIRLSSRRPAVWTTPATGRAVYAADRGGSEFRVTVPGAKRVDVVGDWTGWRPVPLVRRGGSWVTRVTLRPGVYRFNVVIDGTRWIVPPGVTAVDDGFGGKTALLVVP